MRMNINHPLVTKFLSEVSEHILKNVAVEHYFGLPNDKKMSVLYSVFKMMKSSTAFHVKLSDLEFRVFLQALLKKNEENENYEFAAILKDICNNFDAINEVTKPVTKKIKRDVKKERKNE